MRYLRLSLVLTVFSFAMGVVTGICSSPPPRGEITLPGWVTLDETKALQAYHGPGFPLRITENRVDMLRGGRWITVLEKEGE